MGLLNYSDLARMVSRMDSPGVDNETRVEDLKEFLDLARATAILNRRLVTEAGFAVVRFGVDRVLGATQPVVAAAVDLMLNLAEVSFTWLLSQVDRLLQRLIGRIGR